MYWHDHSALLHLFHLCQYVFPHVKSPWQPPNQSHLLLRVSGMHCRVICRPSQLFLFLEELIYSCLLTLTVVQNLVWSNQLNVSHFVIQRQLLSSHSPQIPCRPSKRVSSERLRLVKRFISHRLHTGALGNLVLLTYLLTYLRTASIIQDSGTGPASYVVNATDMHTIQKENVLVKFADDTSLIVVAVNEGTCTVMNIKNWATRNNLTLNESKSVEIVFRNPASKSGQMSEPPPTPMSIMWKSEINHVFVGLLPPVNKTGYDLKIKTHDFVLPCDKNFDKN